MNSQEEQPLTWNEPTADESFVMIVSELIQYDIVHGTTYVMLCPQWNSQKAWMSGPIPCLKLDRKVLI